MVSDNVKHKQRLAVLECKARGLSIRDTATELKLGRSVVFLRLKEINSAAKDDLLESFASTRLPLEWEASLCLNRLIIRRAISISEQAKDYRTQIEALRLASQIQANSNALMADSVVLAQHIKRSVVVVN